MIRRVLGILGVELHRVSHTERLVSMLGAFLGILAVFLISLLFLGDQGALLLVASMGASAVLLFAVPHGALSQPWALVGGHLVSALIGVTCARYIPNVYVAAPLAVGLAVGAMHYLRCIHPPGGATALAATIGGSEVSALGYQFVAAPVLINVVAILATAVLFNYFFAWRRYPVYFSRGKTLSAAAVPSAATETVSHRDLAFALSEMDSFIDVTEQDLLTLYNLVNRSREGEHPDSSELEPGRCYSNGAYGAQWSVRQILEWDGDTPSGERQVVYKGVAGAGRRGRGIVPIDEFAHWAAYEVFRDEENWRRVTDGDAERVSHP